MGITVRERRRLDLLLAVHDCADPAERRHRDTVRRFVEEHANPFDRSIASGHITGSAFVIDRAGNVLLHHHRKLGLWLQLGGHADGEKSAAEVALRESREESGLSDLRFHPGLVDDEIGPLLLDVDVHEIPAREQEPAHLHHDLRFLLVTDDPGGIQRDLEESKALSWVPFDEAVRRGDPGMKRALEKIRRLEAGSPAREGSTARETR